MKNIATTSLPAIAFGAGTAAISLPPSELTTIRTLCETTNLSPEHLSHFLRSLRIQHPAFSHALFMICNFKAQESFPLDNLLIVYAVLRRLAYSEGESTRVAAQEAVWLAFCSAAGGVHKQTLSWQAWFQFQSKLGECVGGVQSLPCQESVQRVRKSWRKVRAPFRDSLTFPQLVQVLRVYDAGLVKCLRAVGFLFTCKLIDAGNCFVEKPVWQGDHDDVFFGQFLTHSIGEAIQASDSPTDSSNTTSPEQPEERPVQRPSNSLLQRPDRQKSNSSRSHVSLGLPTLQNSLLVQNDTSPTAVLPVPPSEMIRRTGNASGKTPFHIDYSSLKLGDKIGSGAYGDVYRGTFLMSPVAVKMFHVNLQKVPRDDQDPSQLNRMSTISALQRFASVNSQSKYKNFVREVEMMSVVRHPNLVLYMGACGDPVTPLCIVSELFTGGSLFEFLHAKEDFRPSLEVALSFSLNIARGMFYLHSSQPSILHRDLKSRNVLLSGRKNTRDGSPHVVICDFGLCQLFGEEGQSSSQMGTASYMSPDVINGEKYEEADDVYSYGILLHEVFTGRVPYQSMRAIQVMFQVANDGLRPSYGKEELPKDITALIEDCWHQEKSKRPGFDEIIGRLNKLDTGLACTVMETS